MALRHRIAPLLALLAIVAAGCGGDDESVAGETEASAPSEERTGTEQTTAPEPDPVEPPPTAPAEPPATAPAEPSPPPPSSGGGGERPPSGGGGSKPDPSRPDGPRNDTPPPPGSPAEEFEEHCERHPEACG